MIFLTLLFFFFFLYTVRDILSRKKKFFLISFEQTLVERNDTNSSELNSLSIDFFFFFLAEPFEFVETFNGSRAHV